MEKLCAVAFFCSLLISITYASTPQEAEKWFQNLSRAKPRVAKLQFYVHDALGKPNATIWEVAQAEITSLSLTSFGQVRALDNLITAKPDPKSENLGRTQGIITSADLYESAYAMNINFVFTGGKYNGSTLCVLGRNPIGSKNRELPIVGGTGVFRMARGFSISNTYSYDPVKNYGVLEYIVYVSYM